MGCSPCPSTKHRAWEVCRLHLPGNNLFFYINSEVTFGRRRREACIEVYSYQATFLKKRVSYLDTSELINLPSVVVTTALLDGGSHLGSLLPSLRPTVQEVVRKCGVLSTAEIDLVLNP